MKEPPSQTTNNETDGIEDSSGWSLPCSWIVMADVIIGISIFRACM